MVAETIDSMRSVVGFGRNEAACKRTDTKESIPLPDMLSVFRSVESYQVDSFCVAVDKVRCLACFTEILEARGS